jgi:hypothetical protein
VPASTCFSEFRAHAKRLADLVQLHHALALRRSSSRRRVKRFTAILFLNHFSSSKLLK